MTGCLPHLLVLNKKDLVPRREHSRIAEALQKSDPSLSSVIFTNSKSSSCKGLKKVGSSNEGRPLSFCTFTCVDVEPFFNSSIIHEQFVAICFRNCVLVVEECLLHQYLHVFLRDKTSQEARTKKRDSCVHPVNCAVNVRNVCKSCNDRSCTHAW